MDITKLDQIKSNVQESDSEESKLVVSLIDIIEQINDELNDQISLSGSEIVKSTLIHVRDNIFLRHLKNV